MGADKLRQRGSLRDCLDFIYLPFVIGIIKVWVHSKKKFGKTEQRYYMGGCF